MPKKNFPIEEPRENPRDNLFQQVRNRWEREGRPGIFEFHYYYLPVAISTSLFWGGGIVNVADEVLDTHLTDELANVQVMPDSGWLARSGQAYVQCLGIVGGGEGPYECVIFDFIFGE